MPGKLQSEKNSKAPKPGKSSGRFTEKPGVAAPYRNPRLPVDERVEDLLARMTIGEKTDQLMQTFVGESDNPNNVGSGSSGP